MLKAIKRLLKDEGGQGLVEYALIIGLVVLVIYVAMNWSGVTTAVQALIGRIATALGNVK